MVGKLKRTFFGLISFKQSMAEKRNKRKIKKIEHTLAAMFCSV